MTSSSEPANGKLQVADFQGTTISLTNPGTIGTGCLDAALDGRSIDNHRHRCDRVSRRNIRRWRRKLLSQLGISKAITISSTYDHRIIQGAESGRVSGARVHELLVGKHQFYDEIFADSEHSSSRRCAGTSIANPFFRGEDQMHEQTVRQAGVMELINAYRVRGHLIADIDPLHAMPVLYHPELDIETYGLTIWDLDRVFITGGLGGTESAHAARDPRHSAARLLRQGRHRVPSHSKQGRKDLDSRSASACSLSSPSRSRRKSRSNCFGN